MSTDKVWLVTGASKGLGLALVRNLLARGYRVAATSRTADTLARAIGDHPGFLALSTELVREQSVAKAVHDTIEAFGRIDVVVNNAGYGQLGTLEELSDEEARRNFDVNVFGALNVIRQVMPHLRRQRSGHVFNIASIAGFTAGFPGWGIYCATKFALAGLTESLAAEAKALGITATVVYPGYFRTDFLSEGSLSLPRKPMPEYEQARAVEAAHLNDIQGKQPGDPDKAAAVLIETAAREDRPLHLFLGADSYDMARSKLDAVRQELAVNEELATSTAF